MKKLIALVLILALPASAFGTTDIAVTSGGSATLNFFIGSVATIPLELTISTDQNGIFGVGGSLVGPAGLIATARAFAVPITNWIANDNAYIADRLLGLKDWGAIEQAGNAANLINAPGGLIETLTISGVATLGIGSYMISVADVPGMEVAGTGWWSNDGNPHAFDNAIPVTSSPLSIIITPEPATMLLLAFALPFLRRRSA